MLHFDKFAAHVLSMCNIRGSVSFDLLEMALPSMATNVVQLSCHELTKTLNQDGSREC